MRIAAALFVFLTALAGCAQPAAESLASEVASPSPAVPVVDERAGGWAAGVSATREESFTFVGTGSPVLRTPRDILNATIEIAWTATAGDGPFQFRLSDDDGVTFEETVDASPALFAFDAGDERLVGERVARFNPAPPGAVLQLEYTLTLTYVRPAE